MSAAATHPSDPVRAAIIPIPKMIDITAIHIVNARDRTSLLVARDWTWAAGGVMRRSHSGGGGGGIFDVESIALLTSEKNVDGARAVTTPAPASMIAATVPEAISQLMPRVIWPPFLRATAQAASVAMAPMAVRPTVATPNAIAAVAPPSPAATLEPELAVGGIGSG